MVRFTFLVPVVLAGALTFISSAAGQETPVAAESATYIVDRVTIEQLAETSTVLDGEGAVTNALSRYTYQIGGRLRVPYNGPVLIYIESGRMQFEATGAPLAITRGAAAGQTPAPGRVNEILEGDQAPSAGELFTLEAGDSVYAPGGDLGLTSNAGDGELVVLAVVTVPPPAEAPDETPAVATSGCETIEAPGLNAGRPVGAVSARGGSTVRVNATSAGTTIQLDDVTIRPLRFVDGLGEGGTYAALEVEFENLGDQPLLFETSSFVLTANGSPLNAICGGVAPTVVDQEIAPHGKLAGWVTFELPSGAAAESMVIQVGRAEISFSVAG